MSSLHHIRIGDTTIEYDVRRSRRRRKTIQISVDHDGVHVAAPFSASGRKLRQLVRKRANWILQQIQRVAESSPPKLEDGATLPYLGRAVRMTFQPASDVPFRFDRWRFRVGLAQGLNEDERDQRIRLAAQSWYRERAAERLPVVVDRWWPKLGRGEKRPLLIRNQRRRWASCAADGTLRFNWRVMMLEPLLIEYIVVHELAHLTVRNHSPAFWTLVADALPDAPARRRRLRAAERAMPL